MFILLSSFLMGLFAAIIPGPILLSGVACILSNDKRGLFQAIKLVLIAVFVEFFIALGIVKFGANIPFPHWFFASLSIIGASLLLWLAWQLWNAQKNEVSATQINFSPWQMVGITIFNPMLWGMWITVSMPLAVEVGNQIFWGEGWYVIIFLSGIVLGHSAIFGLSEIIKEKFLSQAFTKRIFQVVSFGFVLFAMMVIWNGVI